jgi:hypothetical protein
MDPSTSYIIERLDEERDRAEAFREEVREKVDEVRDALDVINRWIAVFEAVSKERADAATRQQKRYVWAVGAVFSLAGTAIPLLFQFITGQ